MALALGLPLAAGWIKEYVVFNLKFRQKIIDIPWERLFWCYLFIMVLINFVRIFDNNFWGDEAYSIRLSKMTYEEMIQATSADVHPPLYYVFVIWGYRIFGEHGWMYHLITFIPYFIMIIFVATVIRKRFGLRTAAIFITLASVLKNAAVYNVEVRMYSLAALFVLLSFYALLCMIEKDTVLNCFWFVMCSLGAAYTHYYALLSVAFFYLSVLVLVICKRIKIRTVLLAYITTVLGYLPWLTVLFRTFKRTSENFWLTYCPSLKECFYYVFQSENRGFVLLMWIVLGISLFLVFCYESEILSVSKCEGKYEISLNSRKAKISNVSIWMFFGILSMMGTIIVGEIVSFTVRPLLVLRYIYPVSVIVWLILGIGVSRITKKKMIPLLMIFVILAVNLPVYFESYKNEKTADNNCQKTDAFMDSVISEDDVIFTNGSHLAWTVLEYYTTAKSCYVQVGDPLKLEEDTAYWLIWSEDIGSDVENWLGGYDMACEEIYHDGLLGDNIVHLYQLTKLK